jgi:16S rRNA (guanine966-N2)-methyltransferase
MRIVGGTWAGVSLTSPGGRVRPTTEDIRVAWLSDLEPELPGARVLDLFAGTGALGLEALSRGAASVDFVENGPSALHALKANVAKLKARDRTRLFKKDALVFLQALEGSAYDLALADPPYSSHLADRLAVRWLDNPFSRILSLEHAADHSLPGRGHRRVFGDTAVTTYRIREGKARLS